MDADYWNSLYVSGDTNWDKGAPAPPLKRLFQSGVVKPAASLVFVGCGPGHDAIEAARQGYRVTAVDYASEAIKRSKANAAKAGVTLDLVQADLFDLQGPFDAVVEHTCFCAIDVGLRPRYVDKVASLLAPGGTLFGLFYAHGREGGPPFDTNEAEVRGLFSTRFEVERLRRAPDSFPARAGLELEAIFRLKG
jgi:SAM-dependent methyltransferase